MKNLILTALTFLGCQFCSAQVSLPNQLVVDGQTLQVVYRGPAANKTVPAVLQDLDGFRGNALFLRGSNSLQATLHIVSTGKRYRWAISPTATNLTELAVPPEQEPILSPPAPTKDEAIRARALGDSLPVASADSPVNVDIMILYTAAAESRIAPNSMDDLISMAMAEANQSYVDSGVFVRLNLVHAGLINYTESSSMSTDLGRLANGSDGYMDTVAALQEQYRADMVSLFIESTDGYAGIAYLLTGASTYAFSVVQARYAVGYYTFPHELGHNLGCAHDRATSPSGAATPYGYGYRFYVGSDQFRTVMAYAPGTRINMFSSPTHSYLGVPVGTATEDNTRTINERAAAIAAIKTPPSVTLTLIRNGTGNVLVAGTNAPSTLTLARGVPVTLVAEGAGFVGWSGAAESANSSVEVSINQDATIVANFSDGTLSLAPSFTVHPLSKSAPVGADVALTADAFGIPTPLLRWKFNGSYLGQTGKTLTLTDISFGNQGAYSCEASSTAGTNTSDVASLTVTATNLPPTLAGLAARTLLEDSSGVAVPFKITDSDSAEFTVSAVASNPNLITIAVQVIGKNGALTFTPVANAFGSATIAVSVSDGFNTNVANMAITVTPVNDAPSYTLSTDVLTVGEDAGVVTNVAFLTSLSTGSGETNQTWTFTVTSTTNVGFTLAPVISTNGTLRFATKPNMTGTNTIRVIMKDNGKVVNGGKDSMTNTFQLVVTPVNDGPAITGLAAKTILEDGTNNLTAAFKIVDSDSSSFTATVASSNTNLVGVAISGTGTNRTLTFSPVTNANGSATITVSVDDGALTNTGSMVLTVTPVNDAPSYTLSTDVLTVGEDAGVVTNVAFLTSLSTGSGETNQTWTFTVTSTTNVGFTLAPVISTNGTLRFATKPNMTGTNTIRVIMKDNGKVVNGGKDSMTNTFQLVVTPVNDGPVITGLAAKTILEDGTNNLTAAFKIVDSDSSSFTATVASSNTNLVGVAISGTGTNRTLTFSPVTNANGSATITVSVDDGALTNTGSMVLTVTPVNDAPSYTLSTDVLTVGEDAGVVTNVAFLTSLSTGSGETNQTWTFTVTSTTNVGFTLAPVISTNGTLRFATKPNMTGTNTIRVIMKDNGKVVNGGKDSMTNTFQLVVTPVNDGPAITGLAAKTILEDGTNNLTAAFKIVDSDSSSFTATVASSNTNLVGVAISGTGTNRTLTFSPVTNANGSATITVSVDDGALTNTGSMVLTVTPVNDAPSYTLSTDVLTVGEDAGVVTNVAFLTSLSTGSGETNQTWTFTVTSTTNVGFTLAPVISTNGTLRFATKPNMTGTNTIRVIMKDNGKVVNGGKDSMTNTFQLVVTPVNDGPAITGLAAKTILEDGTNNLTAAFKIVDSDSSSFTATVASSNTNLVGVAISGTGTNRTLTFSPVTNANGSATITVSVDDGALTNTGSMVLTVSPVNDVPSFNLAVSNVVVDKYSVAVSVLNVVSNTSTGPLNETNQTVSFLVSNNNAGLFLSGPAVSTNGTLTFTPGAKAGSATVTVYAKDNGGVANAGKDTSAGQSFTLTVPTNQFVALQGAYAGLFFDTNTVSDASAGYFRLSLATNGTFTGYLLGAAGSNTFSGQFSISNAAASVSAAGASCALDLALDDGSESVTGTVSNTASHWTSTLLAYQSVYSATATTPLAAEYQMALPGDEDAAAAPGGDGIFALSVKTNGSVTMAGWLADDTAVAQGTHLSREGSIPLYTELKSGATHVGSVYGWVTLTTNGANRASTDSVVAWVKTAAGSTYPNGFTNTAAVQVSDYNSAATDLLSLTNGQVILSGGNLTVPITNSVTITTNVITVNPSATNGLTLVFSRVNGTINGTFVDGSRTNAVDAVILQRADTARGYFLGTSQSGRFQLIGD